jgi:hypothetical protein
MPHATTSRIARLVVATGATVALLSIGSGAALAGEVTGNGELKAVHGRSACAFSGQEDLQWFTNDVDRVPREDPTRGDPGHAQSWGQIPKEVRDTVLIPMGLHPSQSCNPNGGGGEP